MLRSGCCCPAVRTERAVRGHAGEDARIGVETGPMTPWPVHELRGWGSTLFTSMLGCPSSRATMAMALVCMVVGVRRVVGWSSSPAAAGGVFGQRSRNARQLWRAWTSVHSYDHAYEHPHHRRSQTQQPHIVHRLNAAWSTDTGACDAAPSLTVERWLKDAFSGITFDVYGTPQDIDGARNLAQRDKYQFQWWAVSLIDAQPYDGKRKAQTAGSTG